MQLSQSAAKTLCEDNSGKLFEPISNDFPTDLDDATSLFRVVIDAWVRVMTTDANGWIGIEDSSPDDGVANDWIYISSGNTVPNSDPADPAENWRNNEPEDGMGNCVSLRGSKGKWDNMDCADTKDFICEFGENNAGTFLSIRIIQ